jgi:tRNA-modifying protein YgfZ
MADGRTMKLFTDWPATVLVVSGNDRATFLQNMCTADVRSMAAGTVREAFFTNVKGHVLAHAVLIVCEHSIEVVAFQHNLASLVAHLDRYILREDVTLNVADRQPVLAVSPESPPGGGHWAALPMVQASAWVSIHSSEAGAIPPEAVQGDQREFTAIRVASAWPLQGTDFGDAALPQELSRDAMAISFTKGCYLGQETIARLDALGHVNKQIVLVEGPDVELGASLRNGEKEVGTVTSAAEVDGRRLGIAMVRRGSNMPGTKLQCANGEAAVLDGPLT